MFSPCNVCTTLTVLPDRILYPERVLQLFWVLIRYVFTVYILNINGFINLLTCSCFQTSLFCSVNQHTRPCHHSHQEWHQELQVRLVYALSIYEPWLHIKEIVTFIENFSINCTLYISKKWGVNDHRLTPSWKKLWGQLTPRLRGLWWKLSKSQDSLKCVCLTWMNINLIQWTPSQ